MGIEEKRRRIGRFIGLRGCESPLLTGGKTGDEQVDDIAMGNDTDLEMGGQQTEQKGAVSKGMSPPLMAAMEKEGNEMSTYISALLKSTIGTTNEDIAETERRVRRAEDELDEIRRKMGWYL